MASQSKLGRWVFRGMIGATGCLILLAGLALFVAVTATMMADRVTEGGPGSESSPIQIGLRAPDFTLSTEDDRELTLSDFRGQPVALNFWASWCLPCRFEIPVMNQAMRDYADEGLVILSIDVGEQPSDVVEFLDGKEIEYEVLLDPYRVVSDQYSIVSMPTTIWLDAEGIVRAIDYGALSDERIEQSMALVRGETPEE
jgi:thiol-disulfide isomerase/thioredoxin